MRDPVQIGLGIAGVRDPDEEVAAQARRIVPAVRPDVAVLHARLPDGSGIDICREIRSQFPETRALILTSFDDEEALSTAALAGAAGYLLKDIKGNGLTGRSGRHWGWPRRQSRTTSPPSWPSWVWSAARRPRSMW